MLPDLARLLESDLQLVTTSTAASAGLTTDDLARAVTAGELRRAPTRPRSRVDDAG